MRYMILALLLGFTTANAAPLTRVHIHLDKDSTIDGIALRAGDAEIFVPGGRFAAGTLAEATTLMKLDLPADAQVRMETPDRVDNFKLPRNDSAYVIANAPIRPGSSVYVQYSEYYARFHAELVDNPLNYQSMSTVS